MCSSMYVYIKNLKTMVQRLDLKERKHRSQSSLEEYDLI